MSPDQLGVDSVLWQFGHILPVVSVRHFLQASSLGTETHFFPGFFSVLAGSFSLGSVFLAPAFLRLCHILFNPLKCAQERLPAGNTDLAQRRAPRKADRRYSDPNLATNLKSTLCLTSNDHSLFHITCEVIVRNLRQMQ